MIATKYEVMDLKKIIKSLDETFQSENGKSFILHLIRAFLPINIKRVRLHVMDGDKCCLTGILLKNNNELEVQKIKIPDAERVYLPKDLDDYEEDEDLVGKVEVLISKIPVWIPNPHTVLYSDTSDKLMTIEAVLALNKFVKQEILKNNKDINYIADKKFKKKSMDKKQRVEIERPSSTYTLEDLYDASEINAMLKSGSSKKKNSNEKNKTNNKQKGNKK